MDAFQWVVSLNMTLWSIVLVLAFVVFYKRFFVGNVITVDAAPGNVSRTIRQHAATGYLPMRVMSNGKTQRIVFYRNNQSTRGLF